MKGDVETTVEQYGETLAHLKHFSKAERKEVLDRIRFLPDHAAAELLEAWTVISAHWHAQIVAEARYEGREISDAFARAFTATQDHLRAAMTALEAVGPLRELQVVAGVVPSETTPKPSDPEEIGEPPPETPPAIEPVRPIETPSFLVTQGLQAPSAGGLSIDIGAAKALERQSQKVASSPWASAVRVELPEAPLDVYMTSRALPGLLEPARPFVTSPNPPAEFPAVASSTSNYLGETTQFDVHQLVSTVLPFDLDPAAAASSRAAVREPPERHDRNSVNVQSALGGTTDLNIHHIVSKLLPFGTQAAPTLESSRLPPARPAEAPELTLGQYASLTAEIAASAEHAAETRAKYGVPTEKAYRGLNALWEQRFAENGALQERWLRLVGEYRAWLQQR